MRKTVGFEQQIKGAFNDPQNGQQNGLLTASDSGHGSDWISTAQVGLFCPNCGAALEGRKCKLFCLTPGCGYLVTCSEW